MSYRDAIHRHRVPDGVIERLVTEDGYPKQDDLCMTSDIVFAAVRGPADDILKRDPAQIFVNDLIESLIDRKSKAVIRIFT